MHLKNYREKAELTFTEEEKSTWQETQRATHWFGFEDKTQSIVVEFVGKAQSIVVEMFEARFRLADYNC